jgi:serine protease Do
VAPGSVAAQGGVRERDVILEVNRTEIGRMSDYNRAIGDVGAGEVALLLVEREGNTFFIALRVPK